MTARPDDAVTAVALDELRAGVESGDVDTVIVGFPDHYGRLMGKRFDAGFFVTEVAAAGTHGCDYLLTTDIEMEPVPGYAFANWELGYGDFHLVPDLTTMRWATWLDGTALVLCDLETEAHEPVAVAPRSVLARQLDRLDGLGLDAMGASELEYYIFEDSYRQAAEAGYRDLTPVGWYLEDYNILQGTREEFYNRAVRRHLAASGIPVENSKGEWGRGQHEMNIRFAPVGEMADRHTVMKLAMKEIAEQAGVSVTFMAKPFAGQAGSSCHMHVSLWRDGSNAFVAGTETSPEFGGFVAGLLRCLTDVTALLAPTINSYKRFEHGSWAPTRLAWSRDNRTAALRVVGSGPSLRVECRVPGADCNPYLAYAGLIAAGVEGIEDGLALPEAFVGDMYQAEHLPSLPATLRDAATAFGSSDFARSALGGDVHEHYRHFYASEADAFDAAVTDWERARYFERI